MIPEQLEVISLHERFLLSQKPQLKGASNLVRRSLGVQIFEEAISQRYRFLQDLPIENNIRTVYLIGYWQTHSITSTIEDELRSNLRFREPPGGRNLETLKAIEASRNPISLHIRRGDYTLTAEGNIALPLHYYRRAIEDARERLDHPTFFVFSDDIAYARENLPQDIDVMFVDHNDDFSAHEDLRLMSCCQHHILANSTFSWWGAWLNPRESKIVYAPKQWLLKPESYFSDLTPSTWMLLDV
jgi:hypothetical protein